MGWKEDIDNIIAYETNFFRQNSKVKFITTTKVYDRQLIRNLANVTDIEPIQDLIKKEGYLVKWDEVTPEGDVFKKGCFGVDFAKPGEDYSVTIQY